MQIANKAANDTDRPALRNFFESLGSWLCAEAFWLRRRIWSARESIDQSVPTFNNESEIRPDISSKCLGLWYQLLRRKHLDDVLPAVENSISTISRKVLLELAVLPFQDAIAYPLQQIRLSRSEERRVGKECRSRWSP